MDSATAAVAFLLFVALGWLALEVRSLHETMLPVSRLANSPVLQSLGSDV